MTPHPLTMVAAAAPSGGDKRLTLGFITLLGLAECQPARTAWAHYPAGPKSRSAIALLRTPATLRPRPKNASLVQVTPSINRTSPMYRLASGEAAGAE